MIAAPAAVLRAGRNTMQKRQRKHVVVSSCAFSSIQQSRSIALVRKTRRDNVGDNDKTSTSPLSPLRPRPSSVKTEAVAGAKAVAAAAASSSRVPVWLIPDISQADPAAAAAAWAVAGEFSLAQLFARAAAEVGIAFLLARIGVKLLGKLTVESMKVRKHDSSLFLKWIKSDGGANSEDNRRDYNGLFFSSTPSISDLFFFPKKIKNKK